MRNIRIYIYIKLHKGHEKQRFYSKFQARQAAWFSRAETIFNPKSMEHGYKKREREKERGEIERNWPNRWLTVPDNPNDRSVVTAYTYSVADSPFPPALLTDFRFQWNDPTIEEGEFPPRRKLRNDPDTPWRTPRSRANNLKIGVIDMLAVQRGAGFEKIAVESVLLFRGRASKDRAKRSKLKRAGEMKEVIKEERGGGGEEKGRKKEEREKREREKERRSRWWRPKFY